MGNHIQCSENGRKWTAFPELLLLIVLTVAFCGGLVAASWRGASTVDSGSGSSEIREEADRLLDRIEAVLREAIAVSPGQPGRLPQADDGRLAVATDLDGSGGSVEPMYGVSTANDGYQLIVLRRLTPGSSRLVARVFDDNDWSEDVTLTSMLDTEDPDAFSATCLAADGEEILIEDGVCLGNEAKAVYSIRVSIRLRSGTDAFSSGRLVAFSKPVPVVQLKSLPF